MAPRKTPILLRRGPFSGRVLALHRYTRRTVDGRNVIDAAPDGKSDVTGDFDALMLEELIADNAPDIVGILDGAADGQPLDDGERFQVRAFRERLKAACMRHNERMSGEGDSR